MSDYYDVVLEQDERIEELESEIATLKEKNKKYRETLEKIATALETVEPVLSYQLNLVSSFEDFASSVGGGYVSEEQRKWNEIVYDAADIIESNIARRVLEDNH